MNCKSLQAEIEKEVFEVQIKNVNKQLTEYTTDQINHTIALYIRKESQEMDSHIFATNLYFCNRFATNTHLIMHMGTVLCILRKPEKSRFV